MACANRVLFHKDRAKSVDAGKSTSEVSYVHPQSVSVRRVLFVCTALCHKQCTPTIELLNAGVAELVYNAVAHTAQIPRAKAPSPRHGGLEFEPSFVFTASFSTAD